MDNYIKNWDKKLAIILAKKENIELTDRHLVLLKELRNYYKTQNKVPKLRYFITYLKQKSINIDSIEIAKLFPTHAIFKMAKVAGLPEPDFCV